MEMSNGTKTETVDSSLIIAAQNGDESAKETLLEMHKGIIFLLAKRFRCEWVSCEELVQAGHLGFMRALSRYDASKSVKLITYALPWILGEMRCAVRWKEAEVCSLDEPMMDGSLTLHDILEGESGVDIGRLDLRLALCRLSADEQILLCLRYFRDKTQKESAMILGKSQAQISRLERRALDALHEMLS